jgi:hypothetical protein
MQSFIGALERILVKMGKVKFAIIVENNETGYYVASPLILLDSIHKLNL